MPEDGPTTVREPRTPAGPGGSVRLRPRTVVWALLGVVAIATVLRPSVVTVGPLLPRLQDDLGLGSTTAALLTALPVLCFGAGAFAGPALSRRLGVDGSLTAALGLLVVGATVRVMGGPTLLFAGTVTVGAAIAVGNVLLPALVRRDFPARVGLVTGVYTSVLAGASSVAALTAVPLADAFPGPGWRGTLLVWGVAAAAALLLWLPHLVTRTRSAPRPMAALPPSATVPVLHLLRHPVARALTAYMGLQSVGFYTLVAWLPTLLQDQGVTAVTAGALLSLATLIGIPAGLLLPTLAARLPRQRALVVVTTACTAAGWAGLLLAPTAATVLWVVLLGVGTGSTFPLALVLITLRAADPATTPQLSGVVQGVGYLLAALGPLLVGVLHDVTAAWTVPLGLLLVLCAAQALSGWTAGQATTVTVTAAARPATAEEKHDGDAV